MRTVIAFLALCMAPFAYSLRAGEEAFVQKVTPEQFHAALRGVDAAVVVYAERKEFSKVLVRDPKWLAEFIALLQSLKVEAQPAVLSIMESSSVQLYRDEQLSLELWWASDERLVVYSEQWRLELNVGKDIFSKFQTLCRAKGAQKRPNQPLPPISTCRGGRTAAKR
jgi:hypothetical protein